MTKLIHLLFSGDNLDKQKPIEPEWELYLSETAKILTQNQNANGFFVPNKWLRNNNLF